MWKYVSLRRASEGLLEAKRDIDTLRNSITARQEEEKMHPEWLETENMLIVARLVIEAALQRQESRGSHWRSDFPETDQTLAGYHFVFQAAREQGDKQAYSGEIQERQVPTGETRGAPSKEMAYHA
jgi:succinate dehydrogenase/fumarate reductase flavoprotein subunit